MRDWGEDAAERARAHLLRKRLPRCAGALAGRVQRASTLLSARARLLALLQRRLQLLQERAGGV